MPVPEDPRLAAARYRAGQLEDAAAETAAAGDVSQRRDPAGEPEEDGGERAGATDSATRREHGTRPPRTPTGVDRASYVEVVIQQAIRRGEFDDLPGAGQPLPHLGTHHDPDWWIRRKIETEQLTGLGPPALSLRVEDAALGERLDALTREADVREVLEDFNRRVKQARMQLLGGPPVITPLRDVDAEVAAWRERRKTPAPAESHDDATGLPRRRWRRRGRAR